jgi:hypothetical protein
MCENDELLKEAFHKLFPHTSNNYIFIYTPPKVGSTTLVTSLRVSLGKTYNIIHIHDDIMLNVLTGLNIKVNELIEYTSKIGKNIFVIDVYRSPIERKMSEFFEKLSCYHFNNLEENINKYNLNRIVERFNKVYPYLALGDHYFDKYNIENQIPFNFKQRCVIQKEKNINYIKLRLIDSQYWGNILSQILQTKIVLIQDYQTEKKELGELYKRFKEEYRLPLNYYEKLKTDCYFYFYYSEEERNSYLDNWKNKLTDNFVPYSKDEYDFYMNLCFENQYYNDIQFEHYIDNGCFCNGCSMKRRDTYFKALNGEVITEKILHSEVAVEQIKEKTEKIVQKINIVNTINKAITALNKSRNKQKMGGGRVFGLDI